MKFRYKIGDYVVTKGQEDGRIIDAAPSCEHFDVESYEIEFINKGMCPPTMWYPYHWLRLDEDPKDMRCPACGTKWLETRMGNNVWRDCKPCGKKAEDIIKEYEALPPIPTDDLEDWKF